MTVNYKYDVGQLLADIHLEIYQPFFQVSGYQTVSDCAQIDNERLQEMGISLTGHRKRILKKIQEVLEKEDWAGEDAVVYAERINERTSEEHGGTSTLPGCKSNLPADVLQSESSENVTDLFTDYLVIGETNNNISAHSKHQDREILPDKQEPGSYTSLDIREPTESGSPDFFEFQGAMVDNDLYGTVDAGQIVKPKGNKVPTRSFILRNRPVPDLPVSVGDSADSSYSLHITTYTDTRGDVTINSQNKQSGDDNLNPISPYEETFFFRDSESTKEDRGDTSPFCSNDDNGSNESPLNNVRSPASVVLSSVNSGSEESIYSTLEECIHEVGTMSSVSSEDPIIQSPLDTSSQTCTNSSRSSGPVFQEEFSITPYASFYGPTAMLSKAGWLDKLSPHREPKDAVEQFSQCAAHTDASVVGWAIAISTLVNGSYESFIPDLREVTGIQDQVD
ncbi:arf-GAP with Rho-GAP domain, ANK repeat and PH domain-containing protein 2 [Hyperolius riggenbachi]|uniref:arf-GAP with Rho-GAP domain, ANK repeat and PH domain-containing protein 2 n=1 Tax=Hyperolius riggenbachi TaxID=752182 RepID=UPI0035A2C550